MTPVPPPGVPSVEVKIIWVVVVVMNIDGNTDFYTEACSRLEIAKSVEAHFKERAVRTAKSHYTRIHECVVDLHVHCALVAAEHGPEAGEMLMVNAFRTLHVE